MAMAIKPGGTRVAQADQVTWARLVLLQRADKLVMPQLTDAVPYEAAWSQENIKSVVEFLSKDSVLVIKINQSFDSLNELADSHFWRECKQIKQVVIHGWYDKERREGTQSTIDCNPEGTAVVHIISNNYDATFGTFLVDNAGFDHPADHNHSRLEGAVICNFDEVLVLCDTRGYHVPMLDPKPISYETLNAQA